MKIKNITINNFRTFYGETKIDFSSDEERSVSVFIGENGSGKTTILNAIYWAFTGNFTEQFKDADALINKDAKEIGVRSCSIGVEFFNDSKMGSDRYVLKRSHHIGIARSELSLQKINNVGASESISREMIDIVIERFIPKRLANWFIFDGEAMKHMHLNGDPKFKDELFQTFGFSTIKYLSVTLGEIENYYLKEERKLIKDAQLDELSEEIERQEQAAINSEKQLKNQAVTIAQNKRIIEAQELELSNLPQSEAIQGQRERAIRRRDEARAKRSQKERERNFLIGAGAPKLILREELKKLVDELNYKEEKQTLPQPFGTQLVLDIMEKGFCICGTAVLPHSREAVKLEKEMQKAASGQFMGRIFSLRAEVGKYIEQAGILPEALNQCIDDIAIYEGEVSDQEEIIRQSDENISKIPNEVIQSIRNTLLEARGRVEAALIARGFTEGELESTRRQIVHLKAKQVTILSQQGRSSHFRVEREKVSRLSKYVTEQFERQQAEVLDALNKEVSGVLIAYLTKNFTAEIDPKTYAVRTHDLDKRLTSLSTGETNVLKFAVIAAIVGMAGNLTTLGKVNWISEPISAPLIFDAPFSVVDDGYRTSIATNLAKLARQLVLLFDASKWDEKLEELLSPKVGKLYILVSNAKGRDKSNYKRIIINGVTYDLNRYNCERDETICQEIII